MGRVDTPAIDAMSVAGVVHQELVERFLVIGVSIEFVNGAGLLGFVAVGVAIANVDLQP